MAELLFPLPFSADARGKMSLTFDRPSAADWELGWVCSGSGSVSVSGSGSGSGLKVGGFGV